MKVRTDILKLSKSLHTWVGVASGILLFICFFAAGLSMFQHEISQWATPAQQKLPSIQAEQYSQLVEKVQDAYPETQKAFQLNFASKEYFNAPMQWTPPHLNAGRGHFDLAQGSMLASLDEHGELIVKQENLSKVGWLLEQLHESAGIPGVAGGEVIGVYIMGLVAVMYFLAIMSGLVVLLPTLVKDYFAVRKGKNKKRFWLDAHNVVGISSLPFHIIICMTVISYAFHSPFYMGLRVGAFHDKPLFEANKTELVLQQQLDLNQIQKKIAQAAPEYQLQNISFNRLDQPEKASASVAVYHADRLLRGDILDYLFINPYQKNNYDTSNLDSNPSLVNAFIKSMFSLHFGNFGGDPVRWIYFFLAMGGAFLFYSGNQLWVTSRLKKLKNIPLVHAQQKSSVRFLENLNIGACLGCILGIFSMLLAVRWIGMFYPQVHSMNHVMLYGYYAVFVLSVLYAFIIKSNRALLHLLKMVIVVLLATLASSMMMLFLPEHLQGNRTGSLMYVDLILVALSVFFIWWHRQVTVNVKKMQSE